VGTVLSQDLKVIPFNNEAHIITTDNLTLLTKQEGMITNVSDTLTIKHIETALYSDTHFSLQRAMNSGS